MIVAIYTHTKKHNQDESFTLTHRIIDFIYLIKPKLLSHRSNRNIFVHKKLKICTNNIFVRKMRMTKILEPLYEGPLRGFTRRKEYKFIFL